MEYALGAGLLVASVVAVVWWLLRDEPWDLD